MNNIFQKNIIALKIKNPILAEKLQNFIPTDVPRLVQENNTYNLIYKNKYIHNQTSPLDEAKQIFSMSTNEPVSIHLVYGIGLGYLFQITSINSLGTVILYEPDLNFLWLSFSLVDFSNDILKQNVFITDNINDASEAIYKKSGTLNTFQILSLPSIIEIKSEDFTKDIKTFQNIVGTYALDLKYTKENFYPSLKMLIKNIPNLYNEKPLAKFKNIFKEKTAVIVSAGPTLDRNIETLKKYRDRFILFTVGTAVKTLYKNHIKPDFLCIIETYNSSKQVEGLDLKDVYFITEPYANPALRNFKYKEIFSHISANNSINQFWGNICGENIEEYWTKGTVSYTAINCARILGCSKIILVGQDLAYIDGQCYSKDSAYKDLACIKNKDTEKWEIIAKDFESFANSISAASTIEERSKVATRRLERLNKALYYVKGINGDMIPTESVYAAFIPPLVEYAQHFNQVKYINTSMIGAQIDGFENMPLDIALKDSKPIGKINMISDFEYNKNQINFNLNNKLKELLGCLKIILEGQNFAKNLITEINSQKTVDANILKKLKNLSLNYLELSDKFSKQSEMFDFITASNKIDLDYEMKMIRNFTAENILKICNKLSKYYNDAEIRIKEIEGLINENINSKS